MKTQPSREDQFKQANQYLKDNPGKYWALSQGPNVFAFCSYDSQTQILYLWRAVGFSDELVQVAYENDMGVTVKGLAWLNLFNTEKV